MAAFYYCADWREDFWRVWPVPRSGTVGIEQNFRFVELHKFHSFFHKALSGGRGILPPVGEGRGEADMGRERC